MTRFKALSEMTYSMTRIVIGFLFSLHGIEKIFGVMSRDEPAELFSLIGVAGVIELVAGGLVFVGLYTPWAAFVASGQMAFAYFLAHHPRGGWPIENDGERAILYCFVFLYLATRESGPISLDRMIEGRRP